MSAPTFGSLFSGIGGLELGLERAGFARHSWYSEIDPFCIRIHEHHWPGVPNLGDVTKVDWSDVERVDLICGGYPCQPFSLAGSRKGTDDDRHLWPHMRHAIGVLRPRLALLENVPGHLSMGFGEVLGDLADLGYDAEWDCIPAAAVGAPHLRYRLFVVAHRGSARRRENTGSSPGDEGTNAGWAAENDHIAHRDGQGSRTWHVADTEGERFDGAVPSGPSRFGWRVFEGRGALGGEWATESCVGRVAHGVPHRVDRLRALGNAVVPQVAEFIGAQLIAAFDCSEVDA